MTIEISRRYRGPEDSGNGGYTCGMVARFVAADAEITLRSPPPLDQPLSVERTESDGVDVYHGDVLVAQGRSIDLVMDVPAPPSPAEAAAARRRYTGLERHAFPHCFVCGTDRADGLNIWAGKVEGRDVWASTWQPDDSLPATDGILSEEIVWSALDCPGAWAVERAAQERPVVLGRMAARLERPAGAGLSYVAAGWPIGEDGRKLFSGTALFDEDGARYGYALQTWIVLT